jgi:hypothetical protein
MHRENSCLHDFNVLRGEYCSSVLRARTHIHIFCLLDLYSLVGTLIAFVIYAYTRVYTCTSVHSKAEGDVCVQSVRYTHTCIYIIIVECSFYSSVFRLGSFFFSQLYCLVIFFLLRAKLFAS